MDTRNSATRRKTLRNLGALAVSGALMDAGKADGAPAETQEPATGANPPRVLALIGDRYHNADYIRLALGWVFRELNLPMEFTIEPEGQTYAHLLDNLKLNGLTNVRCFRKALGERSGQAMLYSNEAIGGASLLRTPEGKGPGEVVDIVWILCQRKVRTSGS